MFLGTAGSGTSWPLVGRESELRAIAELHDAGGAGVVLLAEAGVGKSRLAREVLERAAAGGHQTAWVQATRSAATVPLGAFAGLMPAEVRSDDRLELMRRSVEVLREQGGTGRLVLGVDDAHVLDPTSAALVLHLVTTGTAFVVVTVRTGEPCPDAIDSLWKDAGAQRRELTELHEAEVGRLVEAIVEGPVDGRAQRWIWEATRGNALFARELVAGALADGALAPVRGLWSLRERPRVTGSLAELIDDRLLDLPDPARRVLELLALGEPLRLRELLDLAGIDPLTELETRAWITVDASVPNGDVQLVHPLYGEAMAASLPFLRAREIRIRLAAVLQAREDATPEDALRVVRWLLDAGEPVPAELLVRAARVANLSGDAELGEDLARRAVDEGADLEASLLLARSFSVRNMFEEAAGVLADAEPAIATQEEALAYLEQSLEVLYWGQKRLDDLRELMDRARDWWPGDEWRGRFAPLRLNMASYVAEDGPGSTVGDSAALLEDPRLDADVRRRVESLHLRGLYWAGRGREAYAFGRDLIPSPPLRDLVDENLIALWAGISAESGEHRVEMERWAADMLRDAMRIDDRGAAGVAALALGHIRYSQGRHLEARRLLAEAELHQERHDPVGLRAVTAALQAAIGHATGDPDAARAAHERCRAAVRGERPLPNQDPYLHCAQAWAVAADGDAAHARRLLLERLPDLMTMPLYGARLAYEAMRLGAPATTVAPLLAELDARSDSTLLEARAAHAAARAASDPAALLRCADTFETIGELRSACEAAAHAAEVFAADAREDSARQAAARSRDLFAEGQGATPPRIEGIDDDSVRLTPREAQLVDLAARGLTNAEIADRLVLSVRTVESHMYRAMQKLGVSDRRLLADRSAVTPARDD